LQFFRFLKILTRFVPNDFQFIPTSLSLRLSSSLASAMTAAHSGLSGFFASAVNTFVC